MLRTSPPEPLSEAHACVAGWPVTSSAGSTAGPNLLDIRVSGAFLVIRLASAAPSRPCQRLGSGVERARRLVEDEYRCVLEERARQPDVTMPPLFLAR
jgi:hypothetical protein